MSEAPYKISSGPVNMAQFGKRLGSGIAKLGKVVAKPIAENEREQKKASNAAAKNAEQAAKKAAADAAKAAAAKKVQAAATRRKTAERKRQLDHVSNLEDLKTQKQVERAKALAEVRNAGKPAAPAAKPSAPKSASRKTPSGVSTDKEGVLKPVASKTKAASKPEPVKARPKLDTKAGDVYDD